MRHRRTSVRKGEDFRNILLRLLSVQVWNTPRKWLRQPHHCDFFATEKEPYGMKKATLRTSFQGQQTGQSQRLLTLAADGGKTQGEHERAWGHSNSHRGRRRVRRRGRRFCGRNPQDFRKIWRGWPWRGRLLPRPPACQKRLRRTSR